MAQEIWRDIPWYEWMYMVSNYWKVLSLNYNKTWKPRVLTEQLWETQYPSAVLSKDWKKTYFLVHRLVAELFIEKIEWKNIINHIDWNRRNNFYKNLEWCTTWENLKHAIHILWHRTHFQKNHPYKWVYWKDSPYSKKVWKYTKTWELIKEYDSISDANRELWLKKSSSISAVCKWKRKTLHWFVWKYI